MPNILEKLKVSRQMIEDALDAEHKFKIPEDVLVELIQLNGYMEIVSKKAKSKITRDEGKRLSVIGERVEEIQINYGYLEKKTNHF